MFGSHCVSSKCLKPSQNRSEPAWQHGSVALRKASKAALASSDSFNTSTSTPPSSGFEAYAFARFECTTSLNAYRVGFSDVFCGRLLLDFLKTDMSAGEVENLTFRTSETLTQFSTALWLAAIGHLTGNTSLTPRLQCWPWSFCTLASAITGSETVQSIAARETPRERGVSCICWF